MVVASHCYADYCVVTAVIYCHFLSLAVTFCHFPADIKVETPKRSSRSGSNARTEQKTEKVSETEEEDEKKVEISRSSARLKGPNNKSSDSDDPYVFQEPEPLESPIKSETPGSPDNLDDEDLNLSIDKSIKDHDNDDSFLHEENLNQTEDDVNEEIEKLEEDSSDPPEEGLIVLRRRYQSRRAPQSSSWPAPHK